MLASFWDTCNWFKAKPHIGAPAGVRLDKDRQLVSAWTKTGNWCVLDVKNGREQRVPACEMLYFGNRTPP
jgi:hypothetical protein